MDLVKKKRTANFREDETKLLILLWGSPSIQDKLSLTHRKAPVMRLIASNMQQRGFYRTPDEIKTRIRNLKCLYHRIKRTMACGAGIGTVDPDWPHYKAMDEVMSKEYLSNPSDTVFTEQLDTSLYDDIQVKQEIEDAFDWDTNDSRTQNGTSMDRHTEKLQEKKSSPSTPTVEAIKPMEGTIRVKKTSTLKALVSQEHATPDSEKNPVLIPQPKVLQTLLPIQLPGVQTPTGTGQTNLPFPFFILNHLNNHGDKDVTNRTQTLTNNVENNDSVMALLRQLIELQTQSLEVSKQKLEIEKQRLDFDRLIGKQLFTFFQRSEYPERQELEHSHPNLVIDLKRKRSASEDSDDVTDSNILRTLLEPGSLHKTETSLALQGLLSNLLQSEMLTKTRQ